MPFGPVDPVRMASVTLGAMPERARADALLVIRALDLGHPALAETMRLALEHGDEDLARLLRAVRRLERTPLTPAEAAAFDRLIDWTTLAGRPLIDMREDGAPDPPPYPDEDVPGA